MTASYAAVAAKPKTVPGSFASFASIASSAKNFTWNFYLNIDNPASISVVAFTVDEARQQVLDTLAKIVPLAAEKKSLPTDSFMQIRELQHKIPATLRLGCFCTDIFDYAEDLIVNDHHDKEVKLGDLIRNTDPTPQPFHLITFFSCLNG